MASSSPIFFTVGLLLVMGTDRCLAAPSGPSSANGALGGITSGVTGTAGGTSGLLGTVTGAISGLVGNPLGGLTGATGTVTGALPGATGSSGPAPNDDIVDSVISDCVVVFAGDVPIVGPVAKSIVDQLGLLSTLEKLLDQVLRTVNGLLAGLGLSPVTAIVFNLVPVTASSGPAPQINTPLQTLFLANDLDGCLAVLPTGNTLTALIAALPVAIITTLLAVVLGGGLAGLLGLLGGAGGVTTLVGGATGVARGLSG